MQPARMLPRADTTFTTLVGFVNTSRATEDGCVCPVCGALNKLKRWHLTPLHFRILQRLADRGVGVMVHWKEFVDDREATKMVNVPKHYGLIFQATQNPDKPFNRSGEWGISQRGIAFLNGEIRLPRYFWGIHDHVIWWNYNMATRDEMRRAMRGIAFDTMIEEIVESRVTPELYGNGDFRVEPVGRT
jgi:hypothetical protein